MEDDVHFTNNNHLKKNMDITWFISFIFITHHVMQFAAIEHFWLALKTPAKRSKVSIL